MTSHEFTQSRTQMYHMVGASHHRRFGFIRCCSCVRLNDRSSKALDDETIN